MSSLEFPVQMFISNILSVSALTWLVMPSVTRLLSFWLNATPGKWRTEITGLGTVAAGLALFVLIFLGASRLQATAAAQIHHKTTATSSINRKS
jgi:hypothetical protein